MLELSSYGWIASASMIGRARPLARYSLPMSAMNAVGECVRRVEFGSSPPCGESAPPRSEEHTSELQSHSDLVCRLLLEKKKQNLLGAALDGGERARGLL